MMKIELASPSQSEKIFETLKAVAADMRSQNIMQWNENYPTKAHVEADLAAKIIYIGWLEDELAGVISIDSNQSPEYAEIPWQFTKGKILVIHRLAVSPTLQKRGIGRQLMDFALAKAVKENFASIRLDAYSKNVRTLRFYENRGYKKRGEIYFPYRNDPFYCYEKQV